MPDISLTITQMAQLDRAINRYVDELGIEFPKVVKQTAKLLNADLLKFSPPKNQAQGRNAVKRDVNRSVLLLDPDQIRLPWLKKALKGRSQKRYEIVQKWLDGLKSGRFVGWKLEKFSPDLHTKARDKRGRVQKGKRIITLDKREHSKYMREVQGHVGSTNKWWAVGAAALGNRVPRWVDRHSAPGRAFVDKLKDRLNPLVQMVNAGKGVDSIDRAIIERAIQRRTKNMNTDVNRILKGGASRYFS